jgi:hypothetical protein
MLSHLNRAGVRYVLIGGIALMARAPVPCSVEAGVSFPIASPA